MDDKFAAELVARTPREHWPSLKHIPCVRRYCARKMQEEIDECDLFNVACCYMAPVDARAYVLRAKAADIVIRASESALAGALMPL